MNRQSKVISKKRAKHTQEQKKRSANSMRKTCEQRRKTRILKTIEIIRPILDKLPKRFKFVDFQKVSNIKRARLEEACETLKIVRKGHFYTQQKSID